VSRILWGAYGDGAQQQVFLECADAARADYLVTGNQKHFPRFWKKTKVVTPREFVSLAALI
jgi:predicted nucleic acid-binding protein